MVKLFRLFSFLIILSTVSCGYFLYPERVGHKKGRIDAGVAILDGAGLIIGIIPGVIAFVVDITTGTIYLPEGRKSLIKKHIRRFSRFETKLDDKKKIYIKLHQESIAQHISEVTGFLPEYGEIVYLNPSDDKEFVSDLFDYCGTSIVTSEK